jgi:hypothetical protein
MGNKCKGMVKKKGYKKLVIRTPDRREEAESSPEKCFCKSRGENIKIIYLSVIFASA